MKRLRIVLSTLALALTIGASSCSMTGISPDTNNETNETIGSDHAGIKVSIDQEKKASARASIDVTYIKVDSIKVVMTKGTSTINETFAHDSWNIAKEIQLPEYGVWQLTVNEFDKDGVLLSKASRDVIIEKGLWSKIHIIPGGASISVDGETKTTWNFKNVSALPTPWINGGSTDKLEYLADGLRISSIALDQYPTLSMPIPQSGSWTITMTASASFVNGYSQVGLRVCDNISAITKYVDLASVNDSWMSEYGLLLDSNDLINQRPSGYAGQNRGLPPSSVPGKTVHENAGSATYSLSYDAEAKTYTASIRDAAGTAYQLGTIASPFGASVPHDCEIWGVEWWGNTNGGALLLQEVTLTTK